MNPGEIILNGSLLAAMPLALAAGLISFLSPCVLPLVPGYLGFVSGSVGSGEKKSRRRIILGAVLFVLGFTLVRWVPPLVASAPSFSLVWLR
jgi:cytochrome c-type biogenesis protein